MPHKVQQLVPAKKEVLLEEMPFWDDDDFELSVFDERVIVFFDQLSKNILRDKEVNRRPEIAALAFWLRRSHLEKIKAEHAYWFAQPQVRYQPLGKVFHVCPANVDTMFMYSWAISLLCGNKNLLRISKRIDSPQTFYLFNCINELASLPAHAFAGRYISVISYGHETDINTYISTRVHARIIWGGDATVQTFKAFGSSPRIKDICFPDRLSFTVIAASAMVMADENERSVFARRFYNDSYTFDQLGCASPQTICFVGEETRCQLALEIFTEAVTNYARQNYAQDMASLAGLKLNQAAGDAIAIDITELKFNNNLVTMAHNSTLNLSHKSCGAGYFYYSFLNNLEALVPAITQKHQTLTYYGLTSEQVEQVVQITKGKGIDRIVPVGTGLEFHYIWDGYRLTEELTATKYVS